MTDPKIDLKTPWVAGVLAYFIPGAGHFYQRRYFKAILYFVCVFGTFLYGMSMGEWRVVYWTENPGRENFGQPAKRNYGYLTQLGIGCPSLFAYAQTRRYRSLENRPVFINHGAVDLRSPLSATIDAQFTGHLVEGDPHDPDNPKRTYTPVTGQIHLEPHNRIFKGTFKGKIEYEDGTTEDFERDLGAKLFVDSKILGAKRKEIAAGILSDEGESMGAEIRGTVPRKFSEWFEAPLDTRALQDINNHLTKQFEMALVYTWIAGLLNILVIWDAVQGPAYGYDDEHYRKSRKSADKSKTKSKTKQAVAVVDGDSETPEADTSQPERAAVAQPAPDKAEKIVES